MDLQGPAGNDLSDDASALPGCAVVLAGDARRCRIRAMRPGRSLTTSRTSRWLVRVASTSALWIAAMSCQSSAETGGGAACTYLQIIQCRGANGCAGERQCLADLSGYGLCACGDSASSDGGPRDAGIAKAP
jgi:hypothetical protein